jgi:hypothetical protein
MTLWYLTHNSKAEAVQKTRTGICSYNVIVGRVNTDTSGYHETLTLFWIHIVEGFLAAQTEKQPLQIWVQKLGKVPYNDGNLPLTYYSRERLFYIG